jgi:hypothetical protein
MPDAFKDIWDIPLSDDERGELEREDIIERPDVIRRVRVSSRKRVFGPRQIEWMIDALNDAWEKLPSGAGAAFYRCAFETIVQEVGTVIDKENAQVKSCRLSRLDLVERLRAYRDDDAGKAQERRITRLEHKQRKHIRALSKWGTK